MVEWKSHPLIPHRELMSQCTYKKELCFLASLNLSFFPHYFISFIIVLEILAVGAVAGWLAHELLVHAVSWSHSSKSCRLSKRPKKLNIIYSLSHKHGSFSSNSLTVPARHWENIPVNFYRNFVRFSIWKKTPLKLSHVKPHVLVRFVSETKHYTQSFMYPFIAF